MHILVATDGTLDSKRAADAVARWFSEGDKVTVFTVMDIPTEFLRRLGDSGIKEAATIAHEAGQGFTAGDRAAEQLVRVRKVHSDPAVDSPTPVIGALAAGARARTKSVLEALTTRGIPADAQWITTENRTARSIIRAIKQYESGLLVIGSHGHGRFEGLLGSTGTKLVRQSPASVLIIRNRVED